MIAEPVRDVADDPHERDPAPDLQAFYARPEVVARYRGDGALTPAERHLVERYLRPGSRVLDVGTGAGRVALALARDGFHVTGVDLSPHMLAAAAASAARQDLTLDLRAADARALPFADDSFDASVFACNGIGHLTADGKGLALRELARVTRPGGAVLLSARTPYALNRMLPGLLVRSAREVAGRAYGRVAPRDEQPGEPYVHRPSMRTLERLVREAGLELCESTSRRVLERDGRPGPFTRFIGGQFFLAARAR